MNVHRLSPTLSLYLARQFAIAFVSVLGVIVGLILLFDIIELLRRTVAVEDTSFQTLFTMALLKLPHNIQETLPFIVLIATMFALFKLARTHELVVMRAAGVSAWQVLGSPLALVGVLGVVNLLFFNPVAADLYETYQRREEAMMRSPNATLNVGEEGLWMREVRGDTAEIVHAVHVHQENRVLHLKAVSIFTTNKQERFERRYEASSGEIADGAIKLDAAWEMSPGQPSSFHEEMSVPSTITPEKIQDSFAAPESMSVWTLPHFITVSEQAGFSVVPHRLYWQSLIVSPFVLVAMMLVASAFCLSIWTRAAAWTLHGLSGLGTGFVFYFFNRFTYALGLSATLPLSLAAWAPTVVAALLGIAYLLHREDG